MIYHGAGTVVHVLLLKFSMTKAIEIGLTKREKICFWAVLAEKVAAAAKLGCYTKWLEFVFILIPQIVILGI